MAVDSQIPDAEAKCGREKYWSEITDEEKINRMRERVKYLSDDFRRLSDLVNRLRGHFHHENGQLLVLFEERGPMRGKRSGKLDDDEVYF